MTVKKLMRDPYISNLGLPGYLFASLFMARQSTTWWEGLMALMIAVFVNYLVTDREE